MKKVSFVLLMIILPIISFGQSMFFDNLKNVDWMSSVYDVDSSIETDFGIGLSKLLFSRDSITENVLIWNFNDSILTIKHYDFKLKKDSLVTSFRYETDLDKGIVTIVINDQKSLEYDVGIVSTGYYTFLTRRNPRKKRKRNKRTHNNR